MIDAQQSLAEWKKWNTQLHEIEKRLPSGRLEELRAIQQTMESIDESFLELRGLQDSLRKIERLLLAHDALKISLMNKAYELIDGSILLFHRFTRSMRSALFFGFIRSHLGLSQNLQKPADIEAMLLAISNLDRQHKDIHRQLSHSQERVDLLRQEYDGYLLEESSHLAARSFGPYRLSGERPWEGLSRLLKGIAIETGQSQSPHLLHKNESSYTRRCQGLMQECSELIKTGIAEKGSQRRRTLRLLRKNLTEIKRLESEMENSLAQTAMSEQRSSLLVKKFTDHATRS